VDALPDSIEPVEADLTRPKTLQHLPPDLDAVIYTAAADGRTEAAYRAAYVDGLKHLQQALSKAGQSPERFIFVSSTAVYGHEEGQWVDETSLTEPTSFSGQILLQGEKLALSGPFAATVVRLSGIYGPERRRLIDLVTSGEARLEPESDPIYTNRIHRDDCAGMLHHLLRRQQQGAPIENVYLGVDHEPAPRRQVLTWIADRLGLPHPPTSDEAGQRSRGGNKRCRNARLLATGYAFTYPTFREGYGEILSPQRPSSPRR
jgi:nucleoside-diphosphate-sugar epimerase